MSQDYSGTPWDANNYTGGMSANPYWNSSNSGNGATKGGFGNWWNQGGLSGSLGAIGAGIGDMFAKNPADSAEPWLNQIPGQLNQYLSPYAQMGMNANNMLQGQYSNMINNPTGEINQIGGTYHSSPGYNFQVNQALGSANRAAAAGGMLGTPAEQQNIAGVTNQLANQDYWQYVNSGLNQYNHGLSGEQGLSQQGFLASNDLANSMSDYLMNQGNLAYTGAINKNQSREGGLGSILSGVGGLLGGSGLGSSIGSGIGDVGSWLAGFF